jgi:hypothetical protein
MLDLCFHSGTVNARPVRLGTCGASVTFVTQGPKNIMVWLWSDFRNPYRIGLTCVSMWRSRPQHRERTSLGSFGMSQKCQERLFSGGGIAVRRHDDSIARPSHILIRRRGVLLVGGFPGSPGHGWLGHMRAVERGSVPNNAWWFTGPFGSSR